MECVVTSSTQAYTKEEGSVVDLLSHHFGLSRYFGPVMDKQNALLLFFSSTQVYHHQPECHQQL